MKFSWSSFAVGALAALAIYFVVGLSYSLGKLEGAIVANSAKTPCEERNDP